MLNWIKMLFHFHQYKVIVVKHYIDTSYYDIAPSTTAISKCAICGNIKTKHLYAVGYLTVEQLNS